ncbi:MMPL family transporter [Embleya scabrispora]|uniref:MMPL family transporter n=1 Tax=Embleya scabrispora TaxID=159449 RepID=UPI0003636405|nr:MMPL family transporter [Embleya scabrispora]MYS85584.1 MMPL family transporter [Streptomyces sp. SID5474]
MFAALARLTTARPRLLLLTALLLLIGAGLLGRGVGDHLLGGGAVDPNSASARAASALDRDFPGSRPNLVLLVGADRPLDAPEVSAQAEELTARLAAEPDVEGVSSPWSGGGATLRTADGRHALVLAHIRGEETAASDRFERLAADYRGTHGALTVELGGSVAVRHDMQKTISEDLVRAELIALPITLLILILVFGSLVAALLPLGVGILAMVGTNAVLRLVSSATDVSVFAQNLTTVLGLGLAVDYGLFVVRRYREELAAGASPARAVTVMLNTAGRTVVFSALTLAVSLAAMLVFPQYFLRSFAYAGIPVVLLAAFGALVILPAALVLLGTRVDKGDLRAPLRRLGRRLRPGGASAPTVVRESRWYRLSQAIMRRAPIVALLTTGVLVALGLPFLGVQFGTADDRQLPKSAESRQVQQVIRDQVDGRPTGSIEIVVGAAQQAEGTADYSARLSALDGVARVVGPAGTFEHGIRSAPAGPAEAGRRAAGSAYISVVPAVEDLSAAGEDLVHQVRAVPAPGPALVGGQTAEVVDAKHAIGSRLWLAGGLILLTTFVLVFLLTGSVVLPILAIVFAALSLTAMFGAVVWVIQDGHLSGLLDFTPTGSIETALPVLMFCIAFGLSMDYGVFLISRIKEEHERTGDHRSAVATGLARTGGIITAAACVLAVVMFAIGTSRVTNTLMLGSGLALAVLVDAFVVRSLLAPAVLALTGKATWWAPAPLRRLHERFGLSEGGPVEPPAAPEPRVPVSAR